MPDHYKFEMDIEMVRALGYRIIDIIADELENPERRPILPPAQDREAMESLFGGALPREGISPETILKTIQEDVLAFSYNSNHPRLMGYALSAPVPLAALIESLVSLLKLGPSYWKLKPASAQIEATVVRWLGEMVGFSSNAAGFLTTGGSMANLVGLAVARTRQVNWESRADGLAGHQQLVAYVSEEGHASLDRSTELLGIGKNQLRRISVDSDYRIRLDLLEKAIQDDRASGRYPFCLIGTAGTVNTGAIDPLEVMADIAAREHLWFHVDGAYGAFAALVPEKRPLFAGIDRADSLVADPHKWLNVPYEAGCILVKSWSDLTDTFSLNPPYLRAATGAGHDFANYGFEMSRADRAIKVWIALRQFGVDCYANMIANHISLAQYLAACIKDDDDLELMFEPVLSICCFRYVPRDIKKQTEQDKSYLNRLNHAIESAMGENGRALVSGTELEGKRVLRACIINHRVTKDGVEETLRIIRQLGRDLDKKMRASSR